MEDYLQKIKFKTNVVLSDEDVLTSFLKIKERLDQPLSAPIHVPTKRFSLFSSTPFKVACSIALLLTISLLCYHFYDRSQEVVFANTSANVKQIRLPDGSKIALRQGSSIVYHRNYQENRNIELQGEALFKVTKDKVHPFTVETKEGKVTVLGTVFSVRSFSNESYTRTLLKEGSVKFADNDEQTSVVLIPGEEALLNNGEEKISVRKVENMDRALAWESHKFAFDNETLTVIMSTISNAFNTKIEIRDKDLGNQRLTLKFNRNESLTKILDVLSDIGKFKYRQEKELIIIEK